jgi:hypothetical protein
VSTQVSELAARRREVLARLGHPDPDAPHVGRILPWRVDGSTVSLRTELDGLGTFTETVTLHGPDGEPIALDVADPAVLGALDVAALTVAVSYLKATLPARIEVHVGPGDGGPGDGHHTRHSARLAMLRSLLGPGLAELAFHAGVGPLEGTFELVVVEAPVGADATGGPGGHAPRTAHWWRPGDRPAVARSSGVAHRAQGTHGEHDGARRTRHARRARRRPARRARHGGRRQGLGAHARARPRARTGCARVRGQPPRTHGAHRRVGRGHRSCA